jgi:hypothetical protein
MPATTGATRHSSRSLIASIAPTLQHAEYVPAGLKQRASHDDEMGSLNRDRGDVGSVRLGACGDHSNHDGESRDLASEGFCESRRHHRMDQQGYFRPYRDGAKWRLGCDDAAEKDRHLVLKKAGLIGYYCRFRPNMKATLEVAP